MLTFIEELDDTPTSKTAPDGVSNDKTDVQVQLKKNNDDSNLESSSVVQDFDSILQKI